MRGGDTPQEACKKAIKRVVAKFKKGEKKQQVGLIAIDTLGNIGACSVLPGFEYAVTIDGRPEVVESYFDSVYFDSAQ